MLVNESKFFKSSSTIKLHICLWNGYAFVIECPIDFQIEKLKAEILLQHFSTLPQSLDRHPPPRDAACYATALSTLTLDRHQQLDETIAKETIYHKIIHVRSGSQLKEDGTLRNQGVQSGDELLLLVKRISTPAHLPNKTRNVGASISIEEITAATKDLTVQTSDSEGQQGEEEPNNVYFNEFLFELRKILLTLIEVAYKILCLDKEAVKAINKSIVKEDNSKIVSQTEIEARAVKQLKDMGFTKAQAKYALNVNHMSVESSIQWLLEHGSEVPTGKDNSQRSTSSVPDEENTTMLSSSSDGAPQSAGASAGDTPHYQARQFLEEFYKRQEAKFTPNPKSITNLMEMGFDHARVVSALRATNNRETEACDYLLAGRTEILPEDMNECLDKDSSMYKAIMSNPVVQLGLCNPRNLKAFQQILDNPGTTSQWLNDLDTGPVLLQISRIYHVEKNANTHNQSNNSNHHNIAPTVHQNDRNGSNDQSESDSDVGGAVGGDMN